MENGLEAELDDELGYSKYDYKNKNTDNSRNGHSDKNSSHQFRKRRALRTQGQEKRVRAQLLKKNQTGISQDI